ncbi:MAG: TerB family tellurite resistance protein [Flavobacterium sp.]
MITYKEKLSLLGDLIQLSRVDGELHDRELHFIRLIADELKVREDDFQELFKLPNQIVIFRSEFQRIEHFYRMALLMHCDEVNHDKEEDFLMQVGVKMGLNPYAMKRVFKMMQASPTKTLEPHTLLELFKEQHN